jgi:hypothetical protein
VSTYSQVSATRRPTITAALLAAVVAPFFVYNAVCQTSAPSHTETPSSRTAADIKDHTANIGVLESILYFNHCSFSGHDSAIVREAYQGFVKRLGGVKPVVPAPEALMLNAEDCHNLAKEINGLVGWHAREDNRPASQE